jgi:hypothetical protein
MEMVMAGRRNKLMLIGLLLAVWFVIADAYWMSKERDINKCKLDKASEFVQHKTSDNIYAELIDKLAAYEFECSMAEGAGYYWNSYKGLAYWEAILTLPVVYRYTLN